MCLTFSSPGWSKADRVPCVCAFAAGTCLTFSLPCWAEADWVLCVGVLAVCACLMFGLPGWSEADWVPCVCTFAGGTCLTPCWSQADCVPCVCVFTGGTCLTFFLPCWSKADCVPCVCVFVARTCLIFPLSADLSLTEFHMFARSQQVRTWHFLCWVGLRLTVSFVGFFAARTCLKITPFDWFQAYGVSVVFSLPGSWFSQDLIYIATITELLSAMLYLLPMNREVAERQKRSR